MPVKFPTPLDFGSDIAYVSGSSRPRELSWANTTSRALARVIFTYATEASTLLENFEASESNSPLSTIMTTSLSIPAKSLVGNILTQLPLPGAPNHMGLPVVPKTPRAVPLPVICAYGDHIAQHRSLPGIDPGFVETLEFFLQQ